MKIIEAERGTFTEPNGARGTYAKHEVLDFDRSRDGAELEAFVLAQPEDRLKLLVVGIGGFTLRSPTERRAFIDRLREERTRG